MDSQHPVPLTQGNHRQPTSPSPTPTPSAPGPSQDSPLGQLARDPLGTLARWWHEATDLVTTHLPLIAPTLVVAVVVIIALRRRLVSWQQQRLTQGARVVRIHPPPQADPADALTLWGNLIGLLRPRWRRWIFGQPHLTFEYVWDGPELHIQLWISGPIPASLIARAVEAAWPAARTTLTDPTPPTPGNAVTTGGTLRLARPDHHPIAADHPTDPLRPLLGAASGLRPGQHAVVQVLARPVTGRRLAAAHRAAAALRGASRPSMIGQLLDALTPGPTPGSATARPGALAAAHPERAAEIRAILDKAAAPRFEAVIRYAAATTLDVDAEASRAWMRGRAHALASAFAVFAGRNHFDRHRLRDAAQVVGRRWMRRGDLLSIGELAALAHLPYDPAVPGLARAGANAVPPPPAIPTGGPGCKVLGEADAGPTRPVALRVSDARHHQHVVGATGSGKSTLIAQLVLADANAGRAAVVIDPRGDLIGDLLDRLPEQVAERVWLIDPDTAPPPALGVLAGTDPHVVGDNLVGIVHRVFADSWGPRTDDILRSAILTLQHTPAATFADVPRLLTDETYRLRATRSIRDEILGGFWAWYAALSPEARATAIGPVMNKLRHFLLRPFVRQIVGTPGPGLHLHHLLNHGGLLLVRVPKGTLGDDTARLLGSFVLAKVWETATARAHQPEHTRRDAALYVDEAHAFLNLPHGLEEMLAEARGYRLSLTLAHQNLAQFPPAMRDAVAANARNKILFATSPQDARDLARLTTPNLTDHDLAHLGAYQAAARLLVHTQETPAFTLTTRPLPDPIPGRASALKAAAREHAEATRRRPPLPDPRRTPNLDSSDLNVPDLNVPDLNVPDLNVPDLNVPDLNVPDFDVSGQDGWDLDALDGGPPPAGHPPTS
ncbi:type IV secretion system DNA-binding domain-containing protein [Actinomadura sp. SCN-SB]|uniref:type IV secretion system DNA-binding domain-containing protein n=1 Tax=Actinomadura sp. SCN-SB TaxID=3373092 RepID=UPI00375294DE